MPAEADRTVCRTGALRSCRSDYGGEGASFMRQRATALGDILRRVVEVLSYEALEIFDDHVIERMHPRP